MKKYLFFDSETTGLPRFYNAPLHDFDNWPRLVQIAWALYHEDGSKISSHNHIIRPVGFEIPEQAARIHGITTDRANREGEDLKSILTIFASAVADAEYLVAHNMSYDEKIVGAEFLRHDMQNIIEEKPRICTMQKSTDFCAIEGNYGYKWPRLDELHYKLFGESFQDAHNAAGDVEATVACFWEMKKRGLI